MYLWFVMRCAGNSINICLLVLNKHEYMHTAVDSECVYVSDMYRHGHKFIAMRKRINYVRINICSDKRWHVLSFNWNRARCFARDFGLSSRTFYDQQAPIPNNTTGLSKCSAMNPQPYNVDSSSAIMHNRSFSMWITQRSKSYAPLESNYKIIFWTSTNP